MMGDRGMKKIARRGFLQGVMSALAAPAIIDPSNLMKLPHGVKVRFYSYAMRIGGLGFGSPSDDVTVYLDKMEHVPAALLSYARNNEMEDRYGGSPLPIAADTRSLLYDRIGDKIMGDLMDGCNRKTAVFKVPHPWLVDRETTFDQVMRAAATMAADGRDVVKMGCYDKANSLICSETAYGLEPSRLISPEECFSLYHQMEEAPVPLIPHDIPKFSVYDGPGDNRPLMREQEGETQ